jgi:hypothetical protein
MADRSNGQKSDIRSDTTPGAIAMSAGRNRVFGTHAILKRNSTKAMPASLCTEKKTGNERHANHHRRGPSPRPVGVDLAATPGGNRMSATNLENRAYLGDSVYAGFDGYHIWLYLNNGEGGHNHIGLEPGVFRVLIDYVKNLQETHEIPGVFLEE